MPKPIQINKGDTGTPITAYLQLDDSYFNLAGKTVQFAMETDAETPVSVVAWSGTNVTVLDESTGRVQYALQSSDVDETGRFRYAFRADSGSESYTTFPTNWAILIVEDTIS